MKKLLFFISLFVFTKISATEWLDTEYKFDHFTYSASMLFGSDMPCYLSHTFVFSVKINDYVKNKVNNNELKNKRVVYEIRGIGLNSNPDGALYLYEIFETDSTYNIAVNNFNSVEFEMFITYDDAVKIINYIASTDFNPLYFESREAKNKWAKNQSISQNEIKAEVDVYVLDDLLVKVIDDELKVYWNGVDLKMNLNQPVARPVQFWDRYILMDVAYFYVFNKKGEKIYQCEANDMLGPGYYIGNIAVTSKSLIWFSIFDSYSWSDYESLSPIYIYSYIENKLYNAGL